MLMLTEEEVDLASLGVRMEELVKKEEGEVERFSVDEENEVGLSLVEGKESAELMGKRAFKRKIIKCEKKTLTETWETVTQLNSGK